MQIHPNVCASSSTVSWSSSRHPIATSQGFDEARMALADPRGDLPWSRQDGRRDMPVPRLRRTITRPPRRVWMNAVQLKRIDEILDLPVGHIHGCTVVDEDDEGRFLVGESGKDQLDAKMGAQQREELPGLEGGPNPWAQRGRKPKLRAVARERSARENSRNGRHPPLGG